MSQKHNIQLNNTLKEIDNVCDYITLMGEVLTIWLFMHKKIAKNYVE